jgi:predicted oxidoreductase
MVDTNGSHPHDPYEQKVADFIRMLSETTLDTILIHHPQVLGDNYEEIVESLNRIADSGKKFVIMPTRERK